MVASCRARSRRCEPGSWSKASELGDLRGEKQFGNVMMTTMARACCNGELNVCKWLYNHGAAEDISRADNYIGNTPMHWACYYATLSSENCNLSSQGPHLLGVTARCWLFCEYFTPAKSHCLISGRG